MYYVATIKQQIDLQLSSLRMTTDLTALFSGAAHIERVDCLVGKIAAAQGQKSDMLDRTIKLVDAQLAKNRASAA